MIIIGKKEQQKIFLREEIHASSDDAVTPSLESVKEELSKMLKKDKELIVVKNVFPQFGTQTCKILAYAYDSKEALDKFEQKKKEKKKVEVK